MPRLFDYRTFPSTLRAGLLLAVAVSISALSGCVVGEFFGGMAESARLNSSTEYEAEYLGLENKTWAVLVSSERSLQAEFPDMVGKLVGAVTNQLASQAESIGWAGFQPSTTTQRYMYEMPRWTSWDFARVGEQLGVDRLILIEITEMRLSEPGNRYTWEGVASARVGVVEIDSGAPNEFAFSRNLRVQFPDDRGYTSTDMPGEAVREQLYYRIARRTGWLFHDHEIPNRQEW